jgi:prepilin signal peptidase PulO-like enzyme (type II secretory pathway)
MHLLARKAGRESLTLEQAARLNSPALKTAAGLGLALFWALSSLQMEDGISALLISLLITAAALIALIDLLTRIVPNELVLAVLILGAAFQLTYYGPEHLLFALLSLLALFLLFTLSAVLFGFDKIGAGDVKLAGAMGLVLGFPFILEAFILMGLAVLFFCMAGLYAHKLTRTSTFPFAPFMMLGMSASLLHIVLI